MATKTTMKAAICKKPKQPVVIEEVPIPEPTGREIRVRVKAASLCHSDIAFANGELGDELLPQIIGHEAVSVVDKLGPDALDYKFQEGDLIAASLWHQMCLTCSTCKAAGPQFCPVVKRKGLDVAGYFSEYTLVDPANAVLVVRAGIPSPAPARNLAPLLCAGATVWEALDRARLHPGETVAILGAGGLGNLAVRYAQALGARVIALDVQEEQLEACKGEWAADAVLNIRHLSPEELKNHIEVLNNGNPADVAIVTTGSVSAYETAFHILRPEGRLVAVGVTKEPIPVPSVVFVSQTISMIGAKVPSRDSIQKCLDFSLRKNILPRVNPRVFRLEDINEMMTLMEAGKVHEGRMVVEFP